jgi:hypothetical protein
MAEAVSAIRALPKMGASAGIDLGYPWFLLDAFKDEGAVYKCTIPGAWKLIIDLARAVAFEPQGLRMQVLQHPEDPDVRYARDKAGRFSDFFVDEPPTDADRDAYQMARAFASALPGWGVEALDLVYQV